MPIRYEELLLHLGFAPDKDPFKSVNAADERKFLPEYFVSPPFFESVWGNSRSPKSCVVFAPTGAGKTAQAIMIQERASRSEDAQILTILYDDFEKQGALSLSNAKLSNHLHVLTRLATVDLLKTIGTKSIIGGISFTNAEREEIQYLASKYLGGANEEVLAASLRSIRSPIQKLSGTIESVASSIPLIASALKLFGMEPSSATILGLQAAAKKLESSTPNIQSRLQNQDRTEWFDFERCMRLLKPYYAAVYILIDKVDETSYTTRNAENAFELVSDLLTNLALLNPTDAIWCFKFFLWDAVQPYYAQQGRTDRIETHNLRWTAEQLTAMLDERVKYYSDHGLSSLTDLISFQEAELNKIGIQDLIMLFSHGSPRDSIRMMQRILECHLDNLNRTGATMTGTPRQIPFDAVAQGILLFSEDRFAELITSAEVRRQMEAIHQVCLTSTTFTTRTQKITTNAANSKINTWKQMGGIDQIGDIMMNRTGKPNRLYAFTDPRIALCASGLSVQNFLADKVGICSHCKVIQVRDWSIGTQHGQCSSCQGILESHGELAWEPPAALLRAARRELTAALPDASYVELIIDDLGFDIEELRAEKYAAVEMMWKWALNRALDSGPIEVARLVDEAAERIANTSEIKSLRQLGGEARAVAENPRH